MMKGFKLNGRHSLAILILGIASMKPARDMACKAKEEAI